MGRLSAYAKQQILKLRFQKHQKITQIVKALTKEDIKISRQSVSTFLKKYLETDSINDKPRSGRKRKLTQDEIKLIGELTKQNPEITARAIKECLNLNVSTYTILRATKLFEWNKINPNSNEAKKAAALERQLRGEGRKRKHYPKKVKKSTPNPTTAATTSSTTTSTSTQPKSIAAEIKNENLPTTTSTTTTTESHQQVAPATIQSQQPQCLQLINVNQINSNELLECESNLYDLKLIAERELNVLKNVACSPMSFATKILFKIYSLDELHGHNVSGKTFHKHISNKKPLEEKRLLYIKWLVEKYFGDDDLVNNQYNKNKELLWKSCCNSINKMIRRSELTAINRAAKQLAKGNGQQQNSAATSASDLMKTNSTANSLNSSIIEDAIIDDAECEYINRTAATSSKHAAAAAIRPSSMLLDNEMIQMSDDDDDDDDVRNRVPQQQINDEDDDDDDDDDDDSKHNYEETEKIRIPPNRNLIITTKTAPNKKKLVVVAAVRQPIKSTTTTTAGTIPTSTTNNINIPQTKSSSTVPLQAPITTTTTTTTSPPKSNLVTSTTVKEPSLVPVSTVATNTATTTTTTISNSNLTTPIKRSQRLLNKKTTTNDLSPQQQQQPLPTTPPASTSQQQPQPTTIVITTRSRGTKRGPTNN